jgi:hypothetical protein
MKRVSRAIAWGAALGWFAAPGACSQGTGGASEPPTEATPEKVARPSAEPARDLSALPSARATLSESASATAADSANSVSEPPPFPSMVSRRDAKGSTVRKIACGTTFCAAGVEACTVVSGSWRCVPSTAELPEGGFQCDDGTDCEAGKTCCASFASASYWTACSKRRGAGSDCSAELCEMDGAPCPTGTACVEGSCRVETRPTCVDKKRCAKDSYCLWGDERKCLTEAETRARPSADMVSEEGILGCTRASDCNGQRCCTSSLGPSNTFCSNECDSANNQVICDTVADCVHLKPLYCMGDETCKMACRRDPANEQLLLVTPPWTNVCGRAESP